MRKLFDITSPQARLPRHAGHENSRRLFWGAVFALAVAATPPAVQAAERPSTLKVSYDDLNLATDAGSVELRARLEAASRKVCRELLNGGRVDAKARYAACVHDSYEAAVRAIAVQRPSDMRVAVARNDPPAKR